MEDLAIYSYRYFHYIIYELASSSRSVSAFLIAETIDWLIFTITKKDFIHRIWISNTISTPIDSIVFVVLAFGWNFDAIWGQALIKYVSSLLVIPFIWYWAKKRKLS